MRSMPMNSVLTIMKSIKKRSSSILGWILLILVTISSEPNLFGQPQNELKIKCIDLIEADWSSGNLYPCDSVFNKYEVTQLELNGFIQCYAFIVRPKCDACEECNYLLFYSQYNMKYYRLSGFLYNEYNDFYNFVLLNGRVRKADGNGVCNSWRQVKKAASIEGVDLISLHHNYYKSYKNCIYDPTSCYRKLRIIKY